nr:hypothetical protein [Poseidonocella sp. HB161398]
MTDPGPGGLRGERVEGGLPAVEEAGADRPGHPFMPARLQEIDRQRGDIDGKRADRLDGIAVEQHAALAAELGRGRHVLAEAAGILDEADRDQPGAGVDQRADGLVPDAPARRPGIDEPHLDVSDLAPGSWTWR